MKDRPEAKRRRQNRWVKRQRKEVALERTVEAACCAALEFEFCWTLKYGREGWPDRLVFLGNGRHVWFEFKRSKFGSLTPAQRRRIPWLRRQGEKVFIVKSVAQGVQIVREERRP